MAQESAGLPRLAFRTNDTAQRKIACIICQRKQQQQKITLQSNPLAGCPKVCIVLQSVLLILEILFVIQVTHHPQYFSSVIALVFI